MKAPKKYELISLSRDDGWYVATMYNRLGQYWKDVRFLYYTKKEILHKLRDEYGCVCPKGTY